MIRSLRAGGAVCLGVVSLFLAHAMPAAAQDLSLTPVVTYPTSVAISSPLSSAPPATAAPTTGERPLEIPRHGLPQGQPVPGGEHASDRAAQTNAAGVLDAQSKTNFGGIGSNGFIPPDPNIAVGETYIVEMVNSEIAIYDKSGVPQPGYPKTLGSFWTGLGSACGNSGDPVVQYDRLATNKDGSTGRWFVTQLQSLKSPYGECIAVSTSSDPGGTYNLYFYSFGSNLNDYPKFGVWPTATNDAYLGTYNMFNGSNFVGAALCGYDREAMLSGASSPAQICTMISTSAGGFLPSDLDGATPPLPGEPGYFLAYNASAQNSLTLYTMTLDFTSPASPSATLGSPVEIPVAAFSPACGGGICIPQPSTNRKLDSLGDRLMYRLAYWNFGPNQQSMVVNHSITSPSGTVAPRWYQLTKSGGQFNAASLAQSGTYAPDSAYRWMGSIAMDQSGDILLGYSRSSSSLSPSIYVAGRVPGDAAGTLSQEIVVKAGGGSQTGYNRWGDYTSMRIDPADDCTFWYVNEYLPQTSFGNWATFIGSHQISGCGGGAGAANFALTVPSPIVVVAGASDSSSKVTVTPSGSFKSDVTLSANCAHPINCTFSPNPVNNGTGNSTMTVGVEDNALSGSTTETITGIGGGINHSITFTVTVPPAQFTLGAAPSTGISVSRGSKVPVSTITATNAAVSGTTNSPVSLTISASHLPRGISATLSPNSIGSNGADSSTLLFTANRNAGTGTFSVTINGNDGNSAPPITVSGTVH